MGYGSNEQRSVARKQSLADADKRMADLLQDTKSSILSFVREFEMRKTADEHRRTVESKSGRLDMDQAWKYRISEDLFKTATTMRDGKSHGFVMFIDWSGSMSGNMEQTMRQLYILFQFCKKVGVPFDVYALGVGFNDRTLFPTLDSAERQNRMKQTKPVVGHNINPNVELLHILSSRGSARDIQAAFRYCLACALNSSYYDYPPVTLGGSTPLDSTIVVAADIVNEFRKQTKVQIVNTVFLTDGDATDTLVHGGWGSIPVLRDGHREWASEGGYGCSTGMLLKWFTEKTQANTIGIFVTPRYSYVTHHIDPNWSEENRKAAEKGFKRDGWCSVQGLGFNEYFVLRGNVVDTEAAMDDFEMRDMSGMTATQIKNSYMKAIENRNGARGMIRRMVDLVA